MACRQLGKLARSVIRAATATMNPRNSMTIEWGSAGQGSATWNADHRPPGLARYQGSAGTTMSPIVSVRARVC